MPKVDEARTAGDDARATPEIVVETRTIERYFSTRPLAVGHYADAAQASRYVPDPWLAIQAAIKRSADVVVAASVLILALPLIVVVAAAIVLESRGGVFYRAERVGLNGKRLRMLKFRKMHRDAAGQPLTVAEDDRFTRVGKLLARTKLDELPQLWHVLRGDMSLIGPRPEDPGFVAERRFDYIEILRVRPGITGLSQLAFAAESEILSDVDPVGHYRRQIFPQKIRLDRMYAARPSLSVDLRIIFWTAAAVFLRREVAVHRATGKMNLRRR